MPSHRYLASMSLLDFAESGGTILFFNDASEYGIEILHLPVKNVLAGVPNTAFYAQGSLLGVEVNKNHPITAGFSAPVPAVWFEDSPTFEVTDTTRPQVVARYQATGDPLAVRLAEWGGQAQRQGGAGRRDGGEGQRGALRIPAPVSGPNDGHPAADLGAIGRRVQP